VRSWIPGQVTISVAFTAHTATRALFDAVTKRCVLGQVIFVVALTLLRQIVGLIRFRGRC